MSYKRLIDCQNFSLNPKSCYHCSFDHTFHMDSHSHPYIELMYCRNGKFNVEISPLNFPDKVETITLTDKQFIIIDAGVMHKITVDNDDTLISNIEWNPVDNIQCSNVSRLVSINAKNFFKDFNGLHSFYKEPSGYKVALDSENLEHCLVYYINCILDKADNFSSECNIMARLIQVLIEIDKCLALPKFNSGLIYVKNAQNYIKNNFVKKITIEDVANHVGVHKAYLQRIFRIESGLSILQYINKLRIEKCKRMLIETNLTIDEICLHLGFTNRQQLIYEFKQYTGITPSDYRRDNLNRNSRLLVSTSYESIDDKNNPIY